MPTFYTDGSCDNRNPKHPGGTGFVRILAKAQRTLKVHSRPYTNTTSNRMEVLAVIHALESIRKPSNVTIYADSQYTIKVARRLATNNVHEGMSNKDLWLRYISVARQHRVTFIHVKGHRGNRFNEVADKLAGRAFQLAKNDPKPEYEDNKQGIVLNGSLFSKPWAL